MRIRAFCVWLLIAGLCLTLSSGVMYSQSQSVADVSAGYNYLKDPDFGFPVGFFGDVGISVSENLQLVGEVARSMRTVTDFGVDVDLTETSYMGGVRFVRRSDALAGYFQTLFGGATVNGGAGNVSGFDVNVSTTVFALQTGGGVIIPISESVGVKLGAAYQPLYDKDFGTSNQFRLLAGISFSLGGR